MKNQLTKKRGSLLGCLLSTFLCLQLFSVSAQERITRVQGIIVNASNTPVSGASITEAGTANSTRTDTDGRFTLNVSAPDATLTVSYIGYETQEVAVAGRTNLQIVLASRNRAFLLIDFS